MVLPEAQPLERLRVVLQRMMRAKVLQRAQQPEPWSVVYEGGTKGVSSSKRSNNMHNSKQQNTPKTAMDVTGLIQLASKGKGIL